MLAYLFVFQLTENKIETTMESDVENKTSPGDGRDDVTSGTEAAGSASPSSNHGGSIRSVILDPFFDVELVYEYR